MEKLHKDLKKLTWVIILVSACIIIGLAILLNISF